MKTIENPTKAQAIGLMIKGIISIVINIIFLIDLFKFFKYGTLESFMKVTVVGVVLLIYTISDAKSM